MDTEVSTFFLFYFFCLKSRYPIYQIPSQRGAQEFSACFLTYHTVSSSFEGEFMFFTEEARGTKACAHIPNFLIIF